MRKPLQQKNPQIFISINCCNYQVVYEDYDFVHLTSPYIPEFLAFREASFLDDLVRKLKKNNPELLPQVNSKRTLFKIDEFNMCLICARFDVRGLLLLQLYLFLILRRYIFVSNQSKASQATKASLLLKMTLLLKSKRKYYK